MCPDETSNTAQGYRHFDLIPCLDSDRHARLSAAIRNSDLGNSHTIFNPLSALLDMIVYIFITHAVVTAVFGIYDRYLSKTWSNR
jgi:hypothetical protein